MRVVDLAGEWTRKQDRDGVDKEKRRGGGDHIKGSRVGRHKSLNVSPSQTHHTHEKAERDERRLDKGGNREFVMIELSLSRDAYKRYEQEIGKSQSRTDRENAFVAQRIDKLNADEGPEAERQGRTHRKVGDAAAVKLRRNHDGDDGAGNRADDADGNARKQSAPER